MATAFKRNSTSRSSKSPKQMKENDNCSRVGSQFQVDIPDFIYSSSSAYENSPSKLEVNLWSPDDCPSMDKMEKYLMDASKHGFTDEAAHVFLRYHKYDTERAATDLANYESIHNTWNKSEVKKFLKCVDGKPRKNFVTVKKCFSAYGMGEVQALYYGIAAPFKAISRHNKRHGRQIQSCYEKALQCGFVPQREFVANCASDLTTDEEETEIDDAIESHFSDMFGKKRAKWLLSDIYKGKTTDQVVQRTLQNGAADKRLLSSCATIVAESLATSSDHSSSVVDTHSREGNQNLLPGLHFNVNKFVEFRRTPRENLDQKRAEQLLDLNTMDEYLKSRIMCVETRTQEVVDGLEAYFPEGGFPKLSYRWTKMELALFVIGLFKYGDDFGSISRILGTKTEYFLDDFYHEYNDRAGLDVLFGKRQMKPETQEKVNNEIIATTLIADASGVLGVEKTEVEEKETVVDVNAAEKVNEAVAMVVPEESSDEVFKTTASVSEPTTTVSTPVKKTAQNSRTKRQSSFPNQDVGRASINKMMTRHSLQSPASTSFEESQATKGSLTDEVKEERRLGSRKPSDLKPKTSIAHQTRGKKVTPKQAKAASPHPPKPPVVSEASSIKPKRGRPSTQRLHVASVGEGVSSGRQIKSSEAEAGHNIPTTKRGRPPKTLLQRPSVGRRQVESKVPETPPTRRIRRK